MRSYQKYLVFTGSFIFFLLTLVENFSASHDSINYLVGISEGKNLVHPHHLFYHIVVYGWVQLLQRIFPEIPDYYLAASFSAFCGSAILTLAWQFFTRRFLLNSGQALAGVLVIAFSYGTWFYSVNIEVYTAPLFFILLCIYYLSGPVSPRTINKLFFFHCCAILFHQVNILFALILIVYIWTVLKEQRYKYLLQYLASGLLLVGGAYFIAGWIVEGNQSLETFGNWVLGYTYGHNYWQPISLRTPFNVITGFSHALIGGHFVFNLSGPDGFMHRILASHNLADEIFIARNLSMFWSWVLLILTLVFCWLLLRTGFLLFRNISAISSRYKILVLLLAGTFILYSLFFLFWMPEILEFWIPQTVIMWLLLAGALPAVVPPKPRFSPVLLMALLLFIINYAGSIRWLQKIENDWYYQMVLPVKEVSEENDLILVEKGWILKDYLDYFSRSAVREIRSGETWAGQIPLIDSVLSNGGKLYLYPAPSDAAGPEPGSFRTLPPHYQGRIFLFSENNPEVWMIRPNP